MAAIYMEHLIINKSPAELTIQLQSLFNSLNDIVIKLTEAKNKLTDAKKSYEIANNCWLELKAAIKNLKRPGIVVSLIEYRDIADRLSKAEENRTKFKVSMLSLETSIVSMEAIKNSIKDTYNQLEADIKGYSNVIYGVFYAKPRRKKRVK